MKTKHLLLIALAPFMMFAAGISSLIDTNRPLEASMDIAPIYSLKSEVTGFQVHNTGNWITEDVFCLSTNREIFRIPAIERMQTNLDPNLLTFKFTDASNRVWYPKWELAK